MFCVHQTVKLSTFCSQIEKFGVTNGPVSQCFCVESFFHKQQRLYLTKKFTFGLVSSSVFTYSRRSRGSNDAGCTDPPTTRCSCGLPTESARTALCTAPGVKQQRSLTYDTSCGMLNRILPFTFRPNNAKPTSCRNRPTFCLFP